MSPRTDSPARPRRPESVSHTAPLILLSSVVLLAESGSPDVSAPPSKPGLTADLYREPPVHPATWRGQLRRGLRRGDLGEALGGPGGDVVDQTSPPLSCRALCRLARRWRRWGRFRHFRRSPQ